MTKMIDQMDQSDASRIIGGALQPVVITRHRRVRPATVLIPLAFLAVHYIVVNLAAILYLFVYIVIQGMGNSLDLSVFSDASRMEQLIYGQTSGIAVLYAIMLIPIYMVYLHFARKRDTQTFYPGKPRIADLLPALAMMIGAMGITNLWFMLLTRLSENNRLIQDMMQDYTDMSQAFSPEGGLILLTLGITVLAPISEELLFRGIIQGELRKAVPEWLAIVLQAVLFALFHMQPIQSSYVIIPGLLLGMAYAWSRSIWVPIAMHILYNFIGSVIPVLVESNAPLAEIVGWTEMAFIGVGLAAGLFFFLNRSHYIGRSMKNHDAI